MALTVIGPDFQSRRSATATSAVKTWVRSHLRLDDAVTVLVAELPCREPGCPPRETITETSPRY